MLWALRYSSTDLALGFGAILAAFFGVVDLQWLIILWIGLLALVIIPTTAIALNYYYYSKDIELVFSHEGISIIDKGDLQKIERINISEIVKVTSKMSNHAFDPAYLPWSTGLLYFFVLKLKSGQVYVLTNFLDSKSEDLHLQLSRYATEIRLIRRIWPWATKTYI